MSHVASQRVTQCSNQFFFFLSLRVTTRTTTTKKLTKKTARALLDSAWRLLQKMCRQRERRHLHARAKCCVHCVYLDFFCHDEKLLVTLGPALGVRNKHWWWCGSESLSRTRSCKFCFFLSPMCMYYTFAAALKI